VLPEFGDMIKRVMGSEVRLIRILLTASDETAADRLVRRELGSRLGPELRTSVQKAPMLEARVPSDTIRVATDGRAVIDIAKEARTSGAG
jgi:hypothetical protein